MQRRDIDVARAHECFIDVRDFKALRMQAIKAYGICFPRATLYYFPRVDDQLVAPIGFDAAGGQHERMMPGVFEAPAGSEDIIVGGARTGLAPFPWMPSGHWMTVRIRDESAFWGGLLATQMRIAPDDNDKAVAHGLATHIASLARVLFTAQEMQRLANTDALTGVLSRRAFMERLEANSGGMLFYIDLDGFKEVNDQLGHAAGDQLLIAVSQAIRNTLRRNDFMGRLGGDEFAVCINVEEADAMTFVERLGQAVARAGARASIGWAPIGSNIAETIHAADQRMYAVKNQHKIRK